MRYSKKKLRNDIFQNSFFLKLGAKYVTSIVLAENSRLTEGEYLPYFCPINYKFRKLAVMLQRYRMGIRVLAKETFRSVRQELILWAGEKIDQMCLDMLLENRSPEYIENSFLIPEIVSKYKAMAIQKIEPLLNEDRIPYYTLLIHSDCEMAVSGEFATPLLVDGVRIESYENIPSIKMRLPRRGWRSPWKRMRRKKFFPCILISKNALAVGFGRLPKVTAQTFDYDAEKTFALDIILGVSKPKMYERDIGSLVFYVRAPQIGL